MGANGKTKMNDAQITVRVPLHLKRKIETMAKQQGVSEGEIVRLALVYIPVTAGRIER